MCQSTVDINEELVLLKVREGKRNRNEECLNYLNVWDDRVSELSFLGKEWREERGKGFKENEYGKSDGLDGTEVQFWK